MSYILDALRRADAERSRGAVPGLHAQNVPTDGEPGARNFNPLIWATGGASVLVVAAAVVLVFGPWRAVPNPVPTSTQAPDARVALAPTPELAPAARDNTPAQPAQGEVPPAQSGALDPGARPIEPPIGRGNPPPAADARPQQAYPPARASARDQLADRAAAGRMATLAPKAGTPAATARPPVEHYGAPVQAAPAPARSTAITNINDLPPDVRSQLPRLAVGGAIYSETPSARMVILNGQVWHEGDKPAADTVLEQIRLKSAVLNFRGQRYEVAF